MLNQRTIELIKSTVPVLEIHGTEITKRFYHRLFESHPELLNLFNHANQKQGRQQTALANAVYAAAKYIDKLETILPVVKQIAHKHRSLGVKPEQYPIVGENLLAAIKDVLGSAATEEVLEAWAEAYGVIAKAFIGVEKEMYEQAEHQPGGWADFRPFRVDRKVRESEVITSFYLVPQDGGALADFRPGQYISVKMGIPGDPHVHIRQYSLSDAPGKPYYRISVKREDGFGGRPDGKVSVHLHEQVREGDVLMLSAPSGDFVLDTTDERPVVLLSGGVGLTPMLSMVSELAAQADSRPVTFIHAARNGSHHAFKTWVEELAAKHSNVKAYWCYNEPSEEDLAAGAGPGAGAPHKVGYIDLPWLRELVPDPRNAVYYFCGPEPFMKGVNSALKELGVPAADRRYEFFGPAGDLEATREPVAAAR